jgi:hypothetical protein
VDEDQVEVIVSGEKLNVVRVVGELKLKKVCAIPSLPVTE